MNAPPALTTLSLPIPWTELGFPDPFQAQATALTHGDIGWAWEPDAPRFPILACESRTGTPLPGWGLDHVVLLVPDLNAAAEQLSRLGVEPRLRVVIKDRPTALFRVGPVLEVIESPVRAPALYGVALVTNEPLEVLALRWRSMGREVSDPEPALQPGRRILTVRDTEAGLAVMSPDGQVAQPE